MWVKLLKTNLRKVMAFDCHKTSFLCETNQTGLVDAEDANGRRNRVENVSYLCDLAEGNGGEKWKIPRLKYLGICE